MTKTETLILKSDRDDFERFYIEYMQENEVSTYPFYKFHSGIGWNLIVLWCEKLNLPFQQLFYSKWKKSIKKYNKVIVFDRNLNWNIISYLKRKNPDIRIIVWYWNMIMEKKQLIPEKYMNMCEIWSFEQEDCRKYGMKKNTQFYFNKLNFQCEKIEYGAIFVGKDKYRLKKVVNICDKLNKCGVSTYTNIVNDNTSCEKNYNYGKSLDYALVLEMINKSQCIIDVPQEGQEGMTARILEALFLEKKMITTDAKVKEKDFYNPNNILIWDNDYTIEEIRNFLEIPYERVSEVIINKYSFKKWLSNFDE